MIARWYHPPMASSNDSTLPTLVGLLVRETRVSIGWTQLELAARARVSQTAISRLERGLRAGLGLDDLQRVAGAMGGRFHVDLRAPFLLDRVRQRDRVHATCIGYVVRRLRRAGWFAESEVEIGGSAGPGWIDVLAWHPASGVLLVVEIKTDLRDFGRLQRTLSWYESRAWLAARRLGWTPRRLQGAAIMLDTATVADGLRANRELANQAFPVRASALDALVRHPGNRPGGRGLAVIDPLSRRAAWIRPTMLDGRRVPPAYRDYAEVARRLGR